ncbi:hypothetical protein DXG01_001296 [Tephrocybe rancida]|nr:hypothetical protein DXG01_001296 [Tephrocybe rancida]
MAQAEKNPEGLLDGMGGILEENETSICQHYIMTHLDSVLSDITPHVEPSLYLPSLPLVPVIIIDAASSPSISPSLPSIQPPQHKPVIQHGPVIQQLMPVIQHEPVIQQEPVIQWLVPVIQPPPSEPAIEPSFIVF